MKSKDTTLHPPACGQDRQTPVELPAARHWRASLGPEFVTAGQALAATLLGRLVEDVLDLENQGATPTRHAPGSPFVGESR